MWIYPVTYRGKPVTGAKVGLVPFTRPMLGEQKAGEPMFTTTDAMGDARFPRTADPSFSAAHLLARDQSGRGGYGLLVGEDQRYPPTIELFDDTKLTGRVTDADGKAVRGLTLKPVA